MEPIQITLEDIRQVVASLLPDILSQYWKEKEKELYQISVIERIIRVEEELKALRVEMNTGLRLKLGRPTLDLKQYLLNKGHCEKK